MRPRVNPPLIAFVDDDAGYLAWLVANPDGYVLNMERNPRPDYLKLHRPSCRDLARRGVRTWTSSYAKVCGPSAALLDTWARESIGGEVDRCPHCEP